MVASIIRWRRQESSLHTNLLNDYRSCHKGVEIAMVGEGSRRRKLERESRASGNGR